MSSKRDFSAFYSHIKVTTSQITSRPGHFRSPVVVTSFPVTSLPPTASNSLVVSEMYSKREFSDFHSYLQETSGQMSSLRGHFRSPEVVRHFLVTWPLLQAKVL